MAASRSRNFAPLLLLFILLAVGGFLVWRMLQKAPVGPVASATLRTVAFSDLPGWRTGDPRPALAAFRRSCSAIASKSSDAIMGTGGYAGTVADWQKVCASAPPAGESIAATRAFFEANFSPREVLAADGSPALFTGYYEPELQVSRTKHGRYQTPIYGAPSNLVSVDLGAFRDAYKGEHLEGCLNGRRLLPCPARAEIDAKGLGDAPLLFYADDPISVFFLHIQGSGRVRLEDGTMMRVAYAGQNGRPYTSVARTLIDRGALPREGMSMQVIRAWMQAHPAEAKDVMEADQSYVFFEELPIGDASLGSAGSEGVPLTPAASLAVDQKFHPLGLPVYVTATRPDSNPSRGDHPFDRLLIAQDTGGAIRGPARGDVFWGFGSDAESIAGRMKSTGRIFVLLPQSVAQHLPDNAEIKAP